MSELRLVIKRFPMHEFTILRLHAFDPEFREICEDYNLATRALDYWKNDKAKADCYCGLIDELALEILDYIGLGERETN